MTSARDIEDEYQEIELYLQQARVSGIFHYTVTEELMIELLLNMPNYYKNYGTW